MSTATKFNDTTNSYKILFFIALLNLLPKRNGLELTIPLREIAVEMTPSGWFPHVYYRLSLGQLDKMGDVIDRLQLKLEPTMAGSAAHSLQLRQAISEQYAHLQCDDLLRYVPYRLLFPFFEGQLRSVPDDKRSKLVKRLCDEAFTTANPPLYRFIESREGMQCIEVHPEWALYLVDSHAVVVGWAANAWVNYLQRRNPMVPAIPLKIAPPPRRLSLEMQTDYWKLIVDHSEVRCLYSDRRLNEGFALDHFIPRSFVCHDQLWNLIPVWPRANSSKGMRLPNERYISKFIEVQTDAITLASTALEAPRWHRLSQHFTADLRLGYAELHDREAVATSYNRIIQPMIALAAQSGFSSGWVFSC